MYHKSNKYKENYAISLKAVISFEFTWLEQMGGPVMNSYFNFLYKVQFVEIECWINFYLPLRLRPLIV